MARKTKTSRKAKKRAKTGLGPFSIDFSDRVLNLGKPKGLGEFAGPWSDERQRLLKLEETVRNLEAVTGGLWKMENGTLIAIRQMSDSHLHNALRRFPGGPVAGKMLAEQERRRVDKEWASRTSTGPQSVEKRLDEARTEILVQAQKIAAIENRPTVTDKVSGRQLAMVQNQVAALETKVGTTNGTPLDKRIGMLTKRVFDLEEKKGNIPPYCPSKLYNSLAFEDVPAPQLVLWQAKGQEPRVIDKATGQEYVRRPGGAAIALRELKGHAHSWDMKEAMDKLEYLLRGVL